MRGKVDVNTLCRDARHWHKIFQKTIFLMEEVEDEFDKQSSRLQRMTGVTEPRPLRYAEISENLLAEKQILYINVGRFWGGISGTKHILRGARSGSSNLSDGLLVEEVIIRQLSLSSRTTPRRVYVALCYPTPVRRQHFEAQALGIDLIVVQPQQPRCLISAHFISLP